MADSALTKPSQRQSVAAHHRIVMRRTALPGLLRPAPLTPLFVSLLILAVSRSCSATKQTEHYIVCKDIKTDVCLTWPVGYEDALQLTRKMYPDIDYTRQCGFSDLRVISPHQKFITVTPFEEEPTNVIFCKIAKMVVKDSSDWISEKSVNTLNRMRRQAPYSLRGRYRGQTQSQYLTIDHGSGKDEGKAEAHSAADSSRASVSGSSGMGQAQSQTMYDPSCDDCVGRGDSDAENLKRRPFDGSGGVSSGGTPIGGSILPGNGAYGTGNVGRPGLNGNFGPGQSGPQSGSTIYGPNGVGNAGFGPNQHGGGAFDPNMGGASIRPGTYGINQNLPSKTGGYGPGHGIANGGGPGSYVPTQNGGFGGGPLGVSETFGGNQGVPSGSAVHGGLPSGSADYSPHQVATGTYPSTQNGLPSGTSNGNVQGGTPGGSSYGPTQGGAYSPPNQLLMPGAGSGSYGSSQPGLPGGSGVFGPNQNGVQGGNDGKRPYGPSQNGLQGGASGAPYGSNQNGLPGGTGSGTYAPGQNGLQGGTNGGPYRPGQNGLPGGSRVGNYGPGQNGLQGGSIGGPYIPGQNGLPGGAGGATYGPGQNGLQGGPGGGTYGPGQNGLQGETGGGTYGPGLNGLQGGSGGGVYGPGQNSLPEGTGSGPYRPAQNGLQGGTGGGTYGPGQNNLQGGTGSGPYAPNQIGGMGVYNPSQNGISPGDSSRGSHGGSLPGQTPSNRPYGNTNWPSTKVFSSPDGTTYYCCVAGPNNNPQYFKLDGNGVPTATQSGVPYTGQGSAQNILHNLLAPTRPYGTGTISEHGSTPFVPGTSGSNGPYGNYGTGPGNTYTGPYNTGTGRGSEGLPTAGGQYIPGSGGVQPGGGPTGGTGAYGFGPSGGQSGNVPIGNGAVRGPGDLQAQGGLPGPGGLQGQGNAPGQGGPQGTGGVYGQGGLPVSNGAQGQGSIPGAGGPQGTGAIYGPNGLSAPGGFQNQGGLGPGSLQGPGSGPGTNGLRPGDLHGQGPSGLQGQDGLQEPGALMSPGSSLGSGSQQLPGGLQGTGGIQGPGGQYGSLSPGGQNSIQGPGGQTSLSGPQGQYGPGTVNGPNGLQGPGGSYGSSPLTGQSGPQGTNTLFAPGATGGQGGLPNQYIPGTVGQNGYGIPSGSYGSYGPGSVGGQNVQQPYGTGSTGGQNIGPGGTGSYGHGTQGDVTGQSGIPNQYGTGQGAYGPQYDNGMAGTGQYGNGPYGYNTNGNKDKNGDYAGIPQNVVDPNSIGGAVDGDDSEAEASVSQAANGTIATASSKGGNDKGRAQTHVHGAYTGGGSFSAQAEISGENKAANSEVTGDKKGASSNAQGSGRNNKSQANVQLGSETGSVLTGSQSQGTMHSSNTQVQGSVKGGMADAQARGPGSTSSQAQIGFTPYKEGDKSHDLQKIPFVGGGTAAAQSSGRTGSSQSQLRGTFKYGITYNGGAQAGASLDKDTVFPNRLPFDKIDVYDESNKNINVNSESPEQTTESVTENYPYSESPLVTENIIPLNQPDVIPSTELPFDTKLSTERADEGAKDSEVDYGIHTHSDHHKTDIPQTVPVPTRTPPAESRRSFPSTYSTNSGDYEYTTDKDENTPDDYDVDDGFGPEGGDATDVEQGEYSTYNEFSRDTEQTHQSLHGPRRKGLEVRQTTGGNTQHIVLGSLNSHDAEITQRNSERPDESKVYQPGERVPGTGGYTIPVGFTGSVKSVASKDKTYVVGSKDSPSQAQTVSLTPGHGKVKYTYPASYARNVNPKNLRSLYQPKPDDSNRYVSVSKSVTRDLDAENNIRKQYSHTYYTKSSSCGYFTFTCTMVTGAEGRKKVCKPKIPTNPDGTPMRC